MIKKFLLILLIVFGLIPFFTFTRTVKAQSGTQCYDVSQDFPTGWTITHGTTQVFSTVGTALFATPGTYNGVQSNYAVATLGLSGVTVHGFTYQLLYTGLGDENIASADFQLYDANGRFLDDDVKYVGFPNSVNLGAWTTYTTKDFNTSAQDHVVIVIKHDQTGSQPSNSLAIHILSYCYDQAQPLPIPSPTGLPTNTPSLTPTPSGTPTRTYTPTATLTPSSTATLDLTNSATPTIPATSTIQSSSTALPGLNSGSFSTVPPPSGCDDDPSNPCGAMPFQPPVYSTLDLASPTYIASATSDAPNVTGTATFTEIQGTAIAFATGANDSGNIAMSIATLTINNGQGTPVSVQDAGNEIGQKVGYLFGVSRELATLNFGKSGALILFILLVTAFMLLVRLLVLVIRLIKALLKMLQQAASAAAAAGE